MGIREATRLTRLVDNLLAYARITDVAHAYSFEPSPLKPSSIAASKSSHRTSRTASFDVKWTCPTDCRWSAPIQQR